MLRVRDILKGKPEQTWSISPESTVFDALKLMAEKEIGALMVMDDKNKVFGIISERDYARKIILLGRTSRETLVKEIMTPAEKMFTVKSDTPVDDCMILITGKHIRHLPVFDAAQFAGLVSIGDVVKSIISEKDTLINHLSDYIAGKY